MTYPHTFRSKHTETVTTNATYGSFLTKGKKPIVPITPEFFRIFETIDMHSDEIVDLLRDFVQIQNISGSFYHRNNMTTAIELVEKWFEKLLIRYERNDIGWCEEPEGCCMLPNVLTGQNMYNYSRDKPTVSIIF